MTREEQIRDAAKHHEQKQTFICGAEWADKNPLPIISAGSWSVRPAGTLSEISTRHEDLEHDHQIMREALEEVVSWFDNLSKRQDDLLGHGLEEACENWEKFPEDFQSLDFTKAREGLSKLRCK